MWYLIKCTVKDPHSLSLLKVQGVFDRETKEYITQEDGENAIQRECKIRFSLAHSALIMSTLLGKRLRYLKDKELARSIITGTYNIPADLDSTTTLILKKIGKMCLRIMNREGKEIIITPEEFIRFWQKVREFMSSSSSGVHYGHYKAAIQDLNSAGLLALQLTVIARSSIPLESWSVGLQIVLEKIGWVCLVEKLWAISTRWTSIATTSSSSAKQQLNLSP
jgi:hypothetical protein